MDVSRTELLTGLPPDEAREILAVGGKVHLLAGAVLFRLGDAADQVFLIERGRLALTMPLRVGEFVEEALVEERTPGEVVGWSALIPPYRLTLTATAPIETDVLAIPRVALLEHLAGRPGEAAIVMRNIAQIMGQRLQVVQAMWLRAMQQSIEWRIQHRPQGAA